MRIALIGYGKMGKAIEKEALERDHEVVLRVTSANKDFDPSELRGVDVAIEFSTPEGAPANIRKCFDADVPVVVGSTGWDPEYEEIRERCEKEGKTLFHAPNFSIGVNIFFAVNRYLADLMNAQEEYGVAVHEVHHKEKKDAPSGTAVRIAKDLLERIERKKEWVKESAEQADELVVSSERKDDVKGTHTVRYDSPIDELSIQHKAHSRKGFALGAVLAAEWVKERRGIFTMRDMLDL